MLTDQEIKYALKQLLLRAGIKEPIIENNNWHNEQVDIRYEPYFEGKGTLSKVIFIQPVEKKSLSILNNLEPNSISWQEKQKLLPPNISLPISEKIPIFSPPNIDEKLFKPVQLINENVVVFHFDVVAAAFFMLSRYEEIINKTRDKYGRFPANESFAYKQGFLSQPIVDEMGLILRAWMQYLDPEWEPYKHKPEVIITHDIDFIRTLPNLRKIARSSLENARKMGIPAGIAETLKIFRKETHNLADTPYVQSIFRMINLLRLNHLKGYFFFKSSRATFYDSGYDVSHPVFEKIFCQIKEANFEIGLHPGFYTYTNSRLLKKEKSSLEENLGSKIKHCRQHYLRFDPSVTWRVQQEAGFQFDHTMAYAQHEGFRCGTCHSFNPFDIDRQKELRIIEMPLIVMDTTLKDYQGYSIDEAKQKIINLAKKCYAVEGTFSLLWHNTSFFGDWEEWGEMYKSVLPALV